MPFDRFKTSLLASLTLAACAAGFAARADDSGTQPLVPGYFDPKTQTFTALVDSLSEISAASTAPAGAALKVLKGKMTLKALVEIDSKVPPGTTISTYGYMIGGSSYGDPRTPHASGVAQAQATAKTAGSTATAVVTFPYQMSVDAATTQLSVNLSVYPGVGGVPALHFTKNIPIPANGATTVVTFPGAF